jgi:hypothetical protein
MVPDEGGEVGRRMERLPVDDKDGISTLQDQTVHLS